MYVCMYVCMYVYTVYSQYSVCCRYTSCKLKQKQGSNCLLSTRKKWFLFIHIVPGNVVDFWNSDFLKKSQLDLPSAWVFFFTFFFAWNFFLCIFPCWIFFGFPPNPLPPTHHFSDGPSLKYVKIDLCRQSVLDGVVDTNVDYASDSADSSHKLPAIFFLLLFTTLSNESPIIEWKNDNLTFRYPS